MKIEKWLYFRNVAAETNDDGDSLTVGHNPTSICFPASAIGSMGVSSTSSITLKLHNLKIDQEPEVNKRRNYAGDDRLVINCTAGKAFEVMEALSQAISNNSHTDGLIVVADDVTTNAANETVQAEYFHPHITSCGTITVYDQAQGTGIHEYYEEIWCNPSADADGEVVGSLSIALQPQSILLEGGITALSLSGGANSSVALNYHSAAVADLSTAAGTEWIGAGAEGGAGDARKPVYTITFAGALVTSNTFDMKVNGTALTQETFASSSDATIEAIAAELRALGAIDSAVVTVEGGNQTGSDDRVITVTGAVEGVAIDMDSLVVAGGSSQTTAAGATTTTPYSGKTSIPAADLHCGSGDIQFDTVHSGTHPPVDRDTAVTHFALKTCEDASGATANAKIGVYVKWFGRPALTIAD